MRISRSRIFVIGLALALAVTLSAVADTLEMKDGRVIRGKYLRGTPANIHFSVDGKVQIHPIAEVSALIFGDEKPAGRPAATQAAPAKSSTSASGSVTVPAGTRLLVRMIDAVDSETNQVGDTFRASLEEDLMVDSTVVAPKGADVRGRLAEVKEAGRLRGKSQLKLELTEITVNQRVYTLTSGDYEVSGASRGGDTAKKVGAGAAIGAVVGAIAGGGKGAAIGAGVGAGAGATIQILTKGEQVRVPSETLLEFALEQPVTIRTATPRTQNR